MAQQPTGKIHGERQDWTANKNRTENAWLTDTSSINPDLIRKPAYFVYLFTVADRPFTVARPTLNISKLEIPLCEGALQDDTAFRVVWKIPSPYNLPYADQTTGEIKLSTSPSAEWVATDICDPNQKELNPAAYVDPFYKVGQGDNLWSKGLFYAHEADCTFDKDDKERIHPIPPAKFVAAAHSRKKAYYNELLDKMKALEYSSPSDMTEFMKWEPDVHLACEYFGIETSWHQVRKQKETPAECPICGAQIKRGAAFHPLPGSRLGVCVNDWTRAIEAGVVSDEDRPGKKAKKSEPVAQA